MRPVATLNLLLTCAAIGFGARVLAAPVQWPVSVGNGHYYEYVPAPHVTWEEARAAAAARTLGGAPGYLATLTSDDEFHFVLDESGFGAVRGEAWVGGSQASGSATPAAGWSWVTGEPFVFAPWGQYLSGLPEPNDLGASGPGEDGGEDFLALFGLDFARGILGNNNYGLFNDEGGTQYIDGYVVEYPVPEPAAPSALAACALGLRRTRRSRRR